MCERFTKSKYRCCKYRNGSHGLTGLNGNKGDKGDPGNGGSSQLYINKTIFVDEKYGSPVGAREDESMPFNTLAGALAIALPLDTIYVHPGTYYENNLILKNNVNWYFELGSSIISVTAGVIFTDGNASITSSIEGHGIFQSNNGILLVGGSSVITFQADEISVSNGTSGFIINTASVVTPSQLNVTIPLVLSGTASPIEINGNVNMNWATEQMTGSAALILVNSTAVGWANFNIQSMFGGNPGPSIPNNGVIYNNGIEFNLNLINQLFTSNSITQAIQSIVLTGGTESTVTNIDSQNFICQNDGGVLYIQGNPSLNIFSQPQVNMKIQELEMNGSVNSGEPFYINQGFVNLNISLLFHVGNPNIFIFNQLNGALLILNNDLLFSETSSAFQCSGSNPSQSNTLKCIMDFIVLEAGTLLSATGSANITIKGDDVSINANPNTAAIYNNMPDSTTVIDIDNLSLSGQGTIGTNQPLIDHQDGDLFIKSINYNFQGVYTIGIQSLAGSSQINISNINTNEPTSTVYISSTFSALSSDYINIAGSGLIMQGNGFLNINVKNIFLSGTGIALDIRDTVGVFGIVSSIHADQNSAISSTTSGNIELSFDEINNTGGVGVSCLNLAGTGLVCLIGNVLNTNSSQIGVNVTNNCGLSLRVSNIYSSQADSVFVINTTDSESYIDYLNLSAAEGSPINKAVFNVLNGEVYIRGGELTVNYFSPTTAPVIYIGGNSYFHGTFVKNTSPSTILSIKSTNEVLYRADQSIVSGASGSTASVVYINSPNGILNYTIGGYMSTPGNYAIEYDPASVQNTIRLSPSTLVSTTNSIYSPGLPMNVIIAPSIANTLTLNIAQIPGGTLFIDPGVA